MADRTPPVEIVAPPAPQRPEPKCSCPPFRLVSGLEDPLCPVHARPVAAREEQGARFPETAEELPPMTCSSDYYDHNLAPPASEAGAARNEPRCPRCAHAGYHADGSVKVGDRWETAYRCDNCGLLRAALLDSHAALEQRAKAAEADLGRAYGDKERAERRVRDLEWALRDVRHRLMTIPDRPGPNSLDIIDAALRGTGEGT